MEFIRRILRGGKETRGVCVHFGKPSYGVCGAAESINPDRITGIDFEIISSDTGEVEYYCGYSRNDFKKEGKKNRLLPPQTT